MEESDATNTSDIDAQIAALEALKAKRLALAHAKAAAEAKERAKVLVDVTPTKPRPQAAENPPSPPRQPSFAPAPKFKPASTLLKKPAQAFTTQPPRASGLAAALAKRRSAPVQALPSLERSVGFGQRPFRSLRGTSSEATGSKSPVADAAKGKGKEKERDRDLDDDDDELEVVRTGTERDADLCVVNDIPLGPGTFGLDPEGENEWRSLEPNSGIRLSKRVLPHADVQDHLYGRYHLRPSQIYSVARLSRDGSTYDVPVDGDWVTIAVVAERGEIRVSGMKDVASDDEDEGHVEGTEAGKELKSKLAAAKDRATKGKSKAPAERKRRPKKYINLKLVSLPPRNKALGGSGVAGDAMLQLLLFESDAIVHNDDGEGGVTRSYRGGSGGAYERWCNLGVGSVIAILNPRILRPLKSGGAAPHPLSLPLALNPQSGDSITLIGHAMDIGRCTALQRDGNRCKAWVDTRLSSVCEYHVHAAVKRGRASRAEFASATTSFELQTRARGGGGSGGGRIGKNSEDYDTYNPRMKRGLLPRDQSRATPTAHSDGNATYVVGSGIARLGPDDALPSFGESHLSERLGRAQDIKRKRKAEQAEAEAALAKILERADDSSVGAKYLAALGKRERKDPEGGPERKRVFNAAAIKLIGFDPTGARDEDPDKRGAAIASLKEASNRPVKLGRPAGPKKLSNVVVPHAHAPKDEEEMIDLD